MKRKVVTQFGCDFCGKGQDEVPNLLRGPNDLCICNECVDVCVETIAKSQAAAAQTPRRRSTDKEAA